MRNNLVLDADVKLWHSKQYNMIHSKPRSDGSWRYLSDIHLFYTHRKLKYNNMESIFKIQPHSNGAQSWVKHLIYEGKNYPIGAKFSYETRDSKAVTYNLDLKKELIEVTQKTETGYNYSIYTNSSTPLWVLVNNRIFPLIFLSS